MTTQPLRLFADRAGSTIAGGISNTSTSVNLQAGGGTLFPNPSSPNFFAATFIDAATGLLEEIVWCTARSTDTLTIIRGQEGSTAKSWNAGDLFQKLLTSGDMNSMLQKNQLLTSAGTYYVNGGTGNDAWTGTSPTFISGNVGPFATMQGAVNTIGPLLSSAVVTINVAAGTYAGVGIGASLIANWNIVGSGAGSCNVSQTTAGTSGGYGFAISQGANVTISGFHI